MNVHLLNAPAAAEARAQGMAAAGDRPRERRGFAPAGSAPLARAQLRNVQIREAGDGDTLRFEGYASVTETAYEMWDMFGPYNEEIALGAFDLTLSRSPDVAFLLNHRGMTLARTTSGTLQLSADDTGLVVGADLDPSNSVVGDIASGLRRGDLTEMSFAFRITRGKWSPDYTSYRIEEVDLDRGDVSVVNYGANPHTSGALRSAQLLAAIDELDGAELVRAQTALAARAATLQAPAGAMSADELEAIARELAPHPLAARFA